MGTGRRIQRINRGRGHSYTIDGKPADGVTTLIGKGVPKPGLPYWSARTVAEYVADVDDDAIKTLRMLGRSAMVDALKGIPWAKRDAAALTGITLHDIAQKLINGEPVEYLDEMAGHVASAVKFMDEWRIEPVLTETVVGSGRWRYGGTLDAVVDLPDRRRAIIDYKTTKSGIFPETALQLAAYRHAEIFVDANGDEVDMAQLGIDLGLAVWIRADGYDVHPVECGPKVFNAFLHVAHVARLIDTDMQAWIGTPVHWSAAATS